MPSPHNERDAKFATDDGAAPVPKAARRRLECSLRVETDAESCAMDVERSVLRVLDEVLSLGGRALSFGRETPLLGAIPELDSMAVVTLITTLEEQLGITIHDDEIEGATFRDVGSLVDFVAGKLAH